MVAAALRSTVQTMSQRPGHQVTRSPGHSFQYQSTRERGNQSSPVRSGTVHSPATTGRHSVKVSKYTPQQLDHREDACQRGARVGWVRDGARSLVGSGGKTRVECGWGAVRGRAQRSEAEGRGYERRQGRARVKDQRFERYNITFLSLPHFSSLPN